jgi:hypothetical protein
MAAKANSNHALSVPADAHPKLRRLLDYWSAAHPAGGGLPGRQHIEPADIPDLLPWLWMLDVERDPLRFKYRLLGTEQVMAMGFNPVGRYLDEVHPRFATHQHYRDYVVCVEEGVPAYRRGAPEYHLQKDYVGLERLLLPLARDGRRVDMLLCITLYGPGAVEAG